MAIPEKWSAGAWPGEAGHSSGSGMIVREPENWDKSDLPHHLAIPERVLRPRASHRNPTWRKPLPGNRHSSDWYRRLSPSGVITSLDGCPGPGRRTEFGMANG